MSRREYKVPYDTDTGALVHNPDEWWSRPREGFDWRENQPFYAELRFRFLVRGKSSACYMWQDQANGRAYPMMLAELADLLAGSQVGFGACTNRIWSIQKRGRCYGIRVATVVEVVQYTEQELSDDTHA